MTPQLTSYPPSRLEEVHGALLAVLRTDPVIGMPPTTVIAPEGIRSDEVGIPTLDLLPCYRLKPGGKLIGRWETESSHVIQIDMELELIQPGTHYVDTCRMVEALTRAIYPIEPVRRAQVWSMLHDNADLGLLGPPVILAGTTSEKTIGTDAVARLNEAIVRFTVEITT